MRDYVSPIAPMTGTTVCRSYESPRYNSVREITWPCRMNWSCRVSAGFELDLKCSFQGKTWRRRILSADLMALGKLSWLSDGGIIHSVDKVPTDGAITTRSVLPSS